MDPTKVIVWAMCLGLAWIVFSSITGFGNLFRARADAGKIFDLEERLVKLESRLEQLEKQKAA